MTPQPELSRQCVQAFFSLLQITSSATWMQITNQPFICVVHRSSYLHYALVGWKSLYMAMCYV